MVGGASRPQTPAFPVHPRTPYVNNSSPTVTFASDRGYTSSNNINNINNNLHHHNHNHMDNNNYNVDRAIYIEERKDVRDAGLPPKSPTTQR